MAPAFARETLSMAWDGATQAPTSHRLFHKGQGNTFHRATRNGFAARRRFDPPIRTTATHRARLYAGAQWLMPSEAARGASNAVRSAALRQT